MAKILITGGAGFIGSHLATRFLQGNHTLRVLDNLSTGNKANLRHVEGKFEWMEGDIRNADDCRRACDGMEFVYHEAALGSVPKSVEEPLPSHDVNMNGTFNVLNASLKAGVRRVIYAASSSAYGDVEESPKHEGIKPRPMSPYAVQKLASEEYARVFFECYGLETISLRYFNVFGPRQDPMSQYAAAIPAFVCAILKGEPPIVYGDGEQSRDFTYIDDVVEGNLLAMKATKTSGEVVNVARGDRITVNQVIAAVNRALGKDVKARHVPPRAGDVRHSCADVSLSRSLLGFQPRVTFDEGLRRTIDYYRSLGTS